MGGLTWELGIEAGTAFDAFAGAFLGSAFPKNYLDAREAFRKIAESIYQETQLY